MNYFAHGKSFTDDPYILAGTAVPDWLSVADRRVRVRRKHAEAFLSSEGPLSAVARGIVQHHQDDAWFHETPAFSELSLELTICCRDALPEDEGFRPSFLGHILVEILLDDALISEDPDGLERYYSALMEIDPQAVQHAVNQMTPFAGGTQRLAPLIDGFRDMRFLFDYRDDGLLLYRLNQVMFRVGLPALPASFAAVLPIAREVVAERRHDLLTRP